MQPERTGSPASRTIIGAALALLAGAARLPFIVSQKIPFDSDEAVEGLMARHLLDGELPAFFWGQAFKGVPEVYLSAATFAIFGSSVAALKSVTLACFAAYVGLGFALLDRIAGRWIAVAASLLLIASPPALVFWSLDASAEYVFIMLTGTAFLLSCLRQQEKPSAVGLGAIGFLSGFGLWTHQAFVFYLVPAAAILLLGSTWWRERRFAFTGRFQIVVVPLGAIAGLYLLLAIVAFVSGGFSLSIGAAVIDVRAPQKMLRIAAGAGTLAVLLHLLGGATKAAIARATARTWPLGLGFVAGYMPVLLYSLFVEPARSPARVADMRRLADATPDLLGNVVPILSGFKIATTERLPIPAVAASLLAAPLAAYLWSNTRRLLGLARLRPGPISLGGDFFPLFVVFVPLLFVVSGAYVDTQSYRYLIPYYAGLAVALAAGSLSLSRGNRAIATAVVGAMLGLFGLQQVLWYRMLTPDTESVRTIECLRKRGVRGGFADYWTSYKLTFLSNEEIIIAPTTGIDRYPAYTAFVRSLPLEQRLDPEHCN